MKDKVEYFFLHITYIQIGLDLKNVEFKKPSSLTINWINSVAYSIKLVRPPIENTEKSKIQKPKTQQLHNIAEFGANRQF